MILSIIKRNGRGEGEMGSCEWEKRQERKEKNSEEERYECEIPRGSHSNRTIHQALRTVRGEGEPKARSSCTNREGIGEMREQR